MNPTNASSNPATDGFTYAMRREIYQQPQAIAKTIDLHLKDDILFPGELHAIESALLTFEKLIIAASGSSRHAGLAGEIMIEDLSGVAVDVEYASEYCYRSTHAAVDPIVMVVTQSGETADTIAAQREALTRGVKTIAVSNVADATDSSRGQCGVDHRSRSGTRCSRDQEFHHAAHGSLFDGVISGEKTRADDDRGHALLSSASAAAAG